ncbi:MAG: hypothetical protein Q8K52_06725 [Thiobacillus sp.]|nr:hypothetical protein [Thiobacillus sp.]
MTDTAWNAMFPGWMVNTIDPVLPITAPHALARRPWEEALPSTIVPSVNAA